MGQYIFLNANVENFSDKHWEEDIYFKTLEIINNFPFPLVSLHKETKLGKDRFTFSNNLVHKQGEEDEYWDIVGDLLTDKRAENFRIYRKRSQYIKNTRTESGDFKDILYSHPDYPECPTEDSEGYSIFDNKTQGYPYQLAVTAVGIYLENLSPYNVYMFGDFTENECASILPWLEEKVGEKLKMPVCYDPDRLWERLSNCYENHERLINRFETLCKKSIEDEYDFFVKKMGKEKTDTYYAEKLAEYSSIDMLGAQNIQSPILNATQDIEELINFVKLANSFKKPEDEKFNLIDLAKSLVYEFITIPFEEREPIRLFTRHGADLMTNEEAFTRLFLTMSGAPSDVQLFVEKNTFIQLFLKHDNGIDEKELTDIITKAENKCRQDIRHCEELIETAKEKIEKEEKQTEQAREKSEEKNPHSHIPAETKVKIPENELFFWEQLYLQKRKFINREKSAAILGKGLKKSIIDKSIGANKTIFVNTNSEKLKKVIYEYTYRNGIALKYTTWNEIDKEMDIEKLTYLAAMALVKNDEMTFWKWRLHIFESTELWVHLVQHEALDGTKKAIED